MGKINWNRVCIGGLLAGAIILVIDFLVNGVLFGAEWHASLKALGQAPSPGSLILFIVWAFVAGICAIWLYAAARPRFGPGPKTAVITGFAFWIFAGALPTVGLYSFGVFPVHLLIYAACAGFVEDILGSLAGARVYNE